MSGNAPVQLLFSSHATFFDDDAEKKTDPNEYGVALESVLHECKVSLGSAAAPGAPCGLCSCWFAVWASALLFFMICHSRKCHRPRTSSYHKNSELE